MTSFHRPQLIVSDSDPDFYDKASTIELAAVKRSERTAGVIQKSPDWDNTATPEQREKRRRESLFLETKVDEKLEADLGGVIKAKFKIEIIFVKNRSLLSLNTVGIQIWESGKKAHGGGDDLMYWCRDNRPAHNTGCWSPISSDNIRDGIGFCPNCKMAINAELLTDLRIGNTYLASLAKEIEKIFRSLGSNADLYLKFHKTDIRYIAMEKAKGPEVAKKLKGMAIYTLANIVKDTTNGANLTNRIKAFLTS